MLASENKAAESVVNALPGCSDSCGGVRIPYPFGISPKCSMPGFELNCTTTYHGTSTPYLGNLTILDISISSGQARVNMPIASQCYNSTINNFTFIDHTVDWWGTPFQLNHEKNILTVIGCYTLADVTLLDNKDTYIGLAGCIPLCDNLESLTNGDCSGFGCCQAALPKGANNILYYFSDVKRDFNKTMLYNFSPCCYTLLMEDTEFMFNSSLITTDKLLGKSMPVVIDWSIGNTSCDTALANSSSFACRSSYSGCSSSTSGTGYLCRCSDVYQGNPYLEGGCQDIDECATQNPCSKKAKCHNLPGSYKCSCPFGWRINHNNACALSLALVIGTCAGIVVLCLLVILTYVVHQRRKLFKLEEKYFQEYGGWILLEKIQSDQGFGFTIFTKQQVEQATTNFDNANIIGCGGQGIVYRGCCLEVEIPMLVYECIQNGTLFDHIHDRNQRSPISLPIRLKIAHESAEALAYLHFSTSPSIFHGDVKSSNILLDENYNAKVSDFGASILSPTDEAQFITLVQGTCGYLDPEYLQSCQLTNKSDVYSFGVVLLELLTSKPVINFNAPEEERSLSSCFLSAMKENKMQELLDDEIRLEDDMEAITEVAELATKCLNIKGEERPTMKEVAEELDRIKKLRQHPWEDEYHLEEMETLLGDD
ncbi:hypothetical protein LUZ63_014430 [Rhynchospora breviuscula]|uniref:Uncharacterized protein n=1 Tax=Rhynchospora breviuscula TaxID=2022672 RepID=A0A9Q0CAN5_9POAL|nr:hypothetical protein LUZ63_014430 [Rhynchospora breviuscula]